MEQDKEYSINCKIQYEPTEGLASLISKGCDAVKEKSFRPRFLNFVGDDVRLNLDYRLKGDLNEFNPNKIHSIELEVQYKIGDTLKGAIIKYFLSPPPINTFFFLKMYPQEKEKTYLLNGVGSNYISLSTDVGNNSQKEFFINFLKRIGVRRIKFGKVSTEEIKSLGRAMDCVSGKYKRIGRTDSNLVFSIYEFLLDSNIPFEFSLRNLIREIEVGYLDKELVLSDSPGIKVSTGSYINTLEKELIEFEQFLNCMQGVKFNKIVYDTESLRRREKSMKILLEKIRDSDPTKISSEVMDSLIQEYSKIYVGEDLKGIKDHIDMDLLHIEIKRGDEGIKELFEITKNEIESERGRPEKKKSLFSRIFCKD